MASKDKNIFSWKRLASSFHYAAQGIVHVIKVEKNFQIHFFIAILVLLGGYIFNLDKIEWLFVIVCIFGMFVLEMINTAIERTIDFITMERFPLAKQAKDLAAGAVLVYALMTVIIGLIIFLPKIIRYFL